MSLYARSDIVCIAVPETAGGCGASHARPVINGAPVDEWQLDCIPCTTYLRKQHDPCWAATTAEIPETPDEKATREDAEKRGERQIKKQQEELSVRQHELTEKIVQMMEGRAPAPLTGPTSEQIGELVAREVAKALAAQQNGHAAVEPETLTEPELNLDRLHWKTLQKMCRANNLVDKGTREDLITRLQAAHRAAI